MDLTNEDVAEILRILEASPYDSLTLETDRFKLTLEREGGPEGGWTQQIETRTAPNVIAEKPAEEAAKPAEAPKKAAPTAEGLVDVTAHLPGTFYRAPKPGADPFVEVGTQVEEDTVIAIIETMKLMNSAYAGVKGTVAEICVENAELVDSGDVIMRVRPES